MVDKSKMLSTKTDVSEKQNAMNIPDVYNMHCFLADKCIQNCTSIQSEINSDEASIFGNKKYKELLKFAQTQQKATYD